MKSLLAWTSFGCAVLFALVGLAAVFGGGAIGIPGVTMIYASVAIAAIGILSAVALVLLGQFD